jgi:hypothetical protein
MLAWQLLLDWLLFLDTCQHQLSGKWRVDTFLPIVQTQEQSSGKGRTLGQKIIKCRIHL